MAANRNEAGKPDAGDKRPDAAPEVATAASSGVIQMWLPMIVALTVLPVVAYLVTSFVLLPKLQKGLGMGPAAAVAEPAAGHGEAKEGKEGKEGKKEGGEASAHGGEKSGKGESAAAPGGREQVPLTKLIVNVSGTSASRILLASVILVSPSPDFKSVVKDHEAQLRDTACGILGTKTIPDLEKPGARNILRSELITAFNHVLGGTKVQEIYFTDFAIQ